MGFERPGPKLIDHTKRTGPCILRKVDLTGT